MEGLFLPKSITQIFKLFKLKSTGINVYNANNNIISNNN